MITLSAAQIAVIDHLLSKAESDLTTAANEEQEAAEAERSAKTDVQIAESDKAQKSKIRDNSTPDGLALFALLEDAEYSNQNYLNQAVRAYTQAARGIADSLECQQKIESLADKLMDNVNKIIDGMSQLIEGH